jgi:hypothetical protein
MLDVGVTWVRLRCREGARPALAAASRLEANVVLVALIPTLRPLVHTRATGSKVHKDGTIGSGNPRIKPYTLQSFDDCGSPDNGSFAELTDSRGNSTSISEIELDIWVKAESRDQELNVESGHQMVRNAPEVRIRDGEGALPSGMQYSNGIEKQTSKSGIYEPAQLGGCGDWEKAEARTRGGGWPIRSGDGTCEVYFLERAYHGAVCMGSWLAGAMDRFPVFCCLCVCIIEAESAIQSAVPQWEAS